MGRIVELVNSLTANMGKTQTDKRTRLVETAMKLAYRDGFRESSLADIAKAAHVPVGNVVLLLQDQGRTRRGCCGAAPRGDSSIQGGNEPVEFSEGAAVCFPGQ